MTDCPFFISKRNLSTKSSFWTSIIPPGAGAQRMLHGFFPGFVISDAKADWAASGPDVETRRETKHEVEEGFKSFLVTAAILIPD